MLLVPTLLALVLGALRIADRTHEANDLARLDRYVVLQEKASTAIDRLQAERYTSALFVQKGAGAPEPRDGASESEANSEEDSAAPDDSAVGDAVRASDSALEDLNKAVGDPATMPGATVDAYRLVRTGVDRLAAVREAVTSAGERDRSSGTDAKPAITPGAVIGQYTGPIEALLGFEDSMNRQLATPALAGLPAGLSALTMSREQVALQHTVIGVAALRGGMLPGDADLMRATDARLSTSVGQFRAGLTAEQQSRYLSFTTSGGHDQRQAMKQQAMSRVSPRGTVALGINPSGWDQASKSVLEEMRTSETGLRNEIKGISHAQQEAQRDAAGIYSVVLLLGLLAAATVVFLVGRSMLKPLRELQKTALDVAQRRLPKAVRAMRAGEVPNVKVAPVKVNSIDEIGQVARAFDQVHGQAVRLAAEQATLQTSVNSMFVNLSRRSQGLVERQLRLIEQLERNEQDSDQLANLFQLDHLATRMRRNSENLLVLSGSDVAKRSATQVPTVDVLRAAVSEIEQYQRVVVQPPPAADLLGRAAGDMVHLVAELLDNATNFSAPDTQVVVTSTRAKDGSVLVEIADQGVGMTEEELTSANKRLSGPNTMDVSASRRMGLFVVGRLAARHEIKVELAVAPSGQGVTARVTVPAGLVTVGKSSAEPAHAAAPEPGVEGRPAAAIAGGMPENPRVPAARVATSSGGVLAVPANGAGVNGSPRVNGAHRAPTNGSGPADDEGGLPRRTAGLALGARNSDGTRSLVPPGQPAPPLSTGQSGSMTAGQPGQPGHSGHSGQPVGGQSGPMPVNQPGPMAGGQSGPLPMGNHSGPPGRSGPPPGRSVPPPPGRPGQGAPTNGRPPGRPHGGPPRRPGGELPPLPPYQGFRPDPTETARQIRERNAGSPIFEEMASAWFQDVRANEMGDDEVDPAANAKLNWGSSEPVVREPRKPADSEMTKAGLPKRAPKANLISTGGSGSSGESGPAAPAAVPARSAEQIRGRLASYQRGVRQGRESLTPDPNDPAADGTDDAGRHAREGDREETT
ncbi:signal transduction histidine kinase [Pseudonocardia eucalypti]|uniref:nitrate- and nitrite sensing domain-containing protein n=1 Tax=Pseudonocardia eucalypti TaxID=648755 RepID=UPI001611D289|nr:signal transduction histidine kinase [Pseudonocardia eucalypti]